MTFQIVFMGYSQLEKKESLNLCVCETVIVGFFWIVSVFARVL